jgi:phosphopantetheinyl transferase
VQAVASQLWVAPVEPLRAVARVLSSAEREECEATSPIVAPRLATSRGLLRRLARWYAGATEEPLAIHRQCVQCGSSRHGRPELAGGPAVSVSRCHSHVVALVNDVACGVDIERADRHLGHLDQLADTVLAPREREALDHLAPERRAAAVLEAWTRKEAVLKADGSGLLRPPSSIDVGGDQALVDGTRWAITTRTLHPEGLLVSTATARRLEVVIVTRCQVSADDDWAQDPIGIVR